jgi:hypothetical protein
MIICIPDCLRLDVLSLVLVVISSEELWVNGIRLFHVRIIPRSVRGTVGVGLRVTHPRASAHSVALVSPGFAPHMITSSILLPGGHTMQVFLRMLTEHALLQDLSAG